jgi:hypothetical protein
MVGQTETQGTRPTKKLLLNALPDGNFCPLLQYASGQVRCFGVLRTDHSLIV